MFQRTKIGDQEIVVPILGVDAIKELLHVALANVKLLAEMNAQVVNALCCHPDRSLKANDQDQAART
jgi:hypothetical protein